MIADLLSLTIALLGLAIVFLIGGAVAWLVERMFR